MILEAIGVVAYAFDLCPDGCWRVAGVNHRFEAATGMNRTGLDGRRPLEAMPPDIAAQVEANLRRCSDDRAVIEFDEQFALPSGSAWWHTTLTPLFEDGQVRRVLGTAFAINEKSHVARLQRSIQQRFKSMFDAMQTGMLLIDPHGLRIVMTNRPAERLFAAAENGLTGVVYTDLVVEEQRAVADQVVTEIVAGIRDSIRLERCFRRQDGRLFWGDVMAVKIGPPLTNRIFWVVFVDDADPIKVTRQRLRDAVEAGPSGFALFDADDRLSLCNTRFAQDMGYANAEIMLGITFGMLLQHSLGGPQGVDFDGTPESWRERRLAWHRQADGTPREIKTRDGRWWLVSESRTSEGWIVLTRTDITALRGREVELQQHQALLRHGAAMAKLGYWIWDERTGHCLFCSEELAAILGMTVARFMDTLSTRDRVIARIHADDRSRCRAMIAESRANGASYHVEFRIRTEAGNYRYVRETATYLADPDARVPRSVGVFQDITEQKSRELELERNRARLERQTAELTRLTEHLDRTAQTAEAANRAKSDFLAHMSHELRTPLNAIIGFSEMLCMQTAGPINAKAHEYASDILTSAHHLLELINNLLDLAKIEAGRFELDEQPVDLRRVVRRSVRMIEDLAASRNVSLNTEVATLPPVVADERGLQRILINLLSNAVKFSERGGRVHMRVTLDDNGEPTLTVQDNGIGIPSHEMDRIFEPFFQTSYTRRNRASGTGLGLPIVRSLVNLHGGRLNVASAVGVGTTVTIHLPRSRLVLPLTGT